jgi:membrane dipeptidase
MIAILFMASALAQSPEYRVDLHLDTPTQMLTKGLHFDAAQGLEASKAKLKAAGTNVVVQVLWPPRKSDHRARAFALLEVVEREVARDSDLVIAAEPAQAKAAVAAGQIAVLLSMEGAHGLGTDSDWAEVFGQFYSRGLRLLGITWSFSNRFAGASSDKGGGLTDEGLALVKLARERRVILDVSHASRETTLAICRDSPAPVIASHSNAHSLRGHVRNLTDEEIRCIARTGGVIGLNFHATFVGGVDGGPANVSRVADHADYLAAVGGHGVVALGTDFDGYIKKPVGLEDAEKVPALWAELERRGWSPEQLRGAKGANFMRAWEQVRGTQPDGKP